MTQPAMRNWQVHERFEPRRGDNSCICQLAIVDSHVWVFLRPQDILPLPATYKINGSIVRHPKKPALKIEDPLLRPGLNGFNEDFLNDVFAIDCRSYHSGAVTMNLWGVDRPSVSRIIGGLECLQGWLMSSSSPVLGHIESKAVGAHNLDFIG